MTLSAHAWVTPITISIWLIQLLWFHPTLPIHRVMVSTTIILIYRPAIVKVLYTTIMILQLLTFYQDSTKTPPTLHLHSTYTPPTLHLHSTYTPPHSTYTPPTLHLHSTYTLQNCTCM